MPGRFAASCTQTDECEFLDLRQLQLASTQQQEQRASLRDRGIAKTHLDGAAAAGSVEVDRCWRRLSSSPLAVGCLVVVVLVAVANLSSTLLATALFSGGATRESNAGAAPAGPIVAAVPTATTKHGAGRAGQASAWPRPWRLPSSHVPSGSGSV